MEKRSAIMEGLWRDYRFASHFLPFLDLNHRAKIIAATVHAPKNIAISAIAQSNQKLASHRLPLLDFSQAMKHIQNTMQIENNTINAISS